MEKLNIKEIVENLIDTFLKAGQISLNLRKKGLTKSLLDQIKGVGKQRKRALLNHFGSARAVESASLNDIKSVEGIEDNMAKKIYDYFHE